MTTPIGSSDGEREALVAELMQLAMELAHVYSFVGDESMPIAKDRLEARLRAALSSDREMAPELDADLRLIRASALVSNDREAVRALDRVAAALASSAHIAQRSE